MPPPSFQPPEPGRVAMPIENSDFGPGEILAPFESPSGPAWGAHIYTGSSQHEFEIKTRPDGCPEWADSHTWPHWLRRGLVVWDHSQQRMGSLLAGEAVELLGKLQANADWKTDGIAIIERHTNWLTLDKPASRKRARKKKGIDPDPPVTESKPESKFYEEERLRLTGRAAEEFVAYLQANETQLKKMADEEEQLHQKLAWRVFTVLAELNNRHEFNGFDGTGRKFPWVKQEFPPALVCEVPPDRATIKLSDDHWWWLPIIERPNHLKHDYERFLMLKEALDWVEKTIPEMRAADEDYRKAREHEEAEERAKIAALPTKDLAPFRINPTDLEPDRITYRVLIELEYEPYHYKKTEISFGQYWRSDQEFYTPTMLARELQINPSLVDIQQISKFLGWYYLRSATTYYEAPIAAAQAQRLWDQSAITERHEQQKVIRARYGFEEVETDYCVWLGGVEQPDHPWPTEDNRADYMANWARRETLLYALDVNGYRQFTEASYKYVTDEILLERMHRLRAKSRCLPDEARGESQRWLAENVKQ